MCINIHNINNNTRPLKDVVKSMASNWYTAQILLYKMMMMMPFICSYRNKNEPTAIYPSLGTQLNPPATSGKQAITKEEYLIKVGKLMSLPILREKATDWLNSAIQHLCKPDPQDSQGRNTIKRVFLCHCVLNENIKY